VDDGGFGDFEYRGRNGRSFDGFFRELLLERFRIYENLQESSLIH
jgi:hypothetical protein